MTAVRTVYTDILKIGPDSLLDAANEHWKIDLTACAMDLNIASALWV